MSTTWIKRSEREPTKTDLPLLTTCYLDNEWCTQFWTKWVPGKTHGYTHWQQFRADPPPRELTQREVDKALACNIAMVDDGTVTECVLVAIYAERREVAKLLTSYFCGADWGLATNSPALNSLRARLDELGGGK